MEKLDLKTKDIIAENIIKLKQLFPEVFTEGKVDIDKLKEVLGDKVETENEKYEFTWNGKKQALRESFKQSMGTLRPHKESSKNWDTTENLYIEGDNLEVLKLLQKSYHNKIKMIYIDPPYNTGNDFVYKDDYRDNLNNYKKTTGQELKSNPETSGRYHTDWLNMMYPRLRLARNLLMGDGVIFISIDDNEQANLKKIADEIFGEINFIGLFIKQSKVGGGSDSKHIAREHEYCMVYSKDITMAPEMLTSHTDEYLKRYKEQDENGCYFWDTLSRPGLKNPINYDVVAPDGSIINGDWIISKKRFDSDLLEGKIKIAPKKEGGWSVQFKQYLSEGKKPRSMTTDFGGTYEGKKEISELFNNDKIFLYPKYTNFVSKLLSFIKYQEKDSLILDFFSGSATTAHAVMQLNAEDGGNRKFIMVQLPEKTDEKSEAFKAGYKNLCEIGKERIRRAGDKIVEETGIKDLDIGFKVFKLDDSNFKTWDADTIAPESTLFDMQEYIKEGRTEDDIIFEVMLKYGLDLTYKIEEMKIGEEVVYSIGAGALFFCLSKDIKIELVEQIAKLRPLRVVFLENGFTTDVVKTNAMQILKQYNIQEVKTV